MSVGRELQSAAGDADPTAEFIDAGERDRSGRRLDDAGGAGQPRGDESVAQHEVGRGNDPPGTDDRSRSQGQQRGALREGADVQGAAADGDRAGRIQAVIPADGEGAAVDVRAAGVGVGTEEIQRAVAGLRQTSGGVSRAEGRDGDGRSRSAPADELELGNGPGDVSSRIGDDDADDLSDQGIDHRITLGRGTTWNDAFGAETDERRADVAGTTAQGHVSLGDAKAGSSPQGRLDGHVEGVGVDDETSREVRSRRAEARGVVGVTARTVGDRAVKQGIDGRSLDRGREETRQVGARLQGAARRREVDRIIGGGREARGEIGASAERARREVDEGFGVGIV